jgi:hypothetical protein
MNKDDKLIFICLLIYSLLSLRRYKDCATFILIKKVIFKVIRGIFKSIVIKFIFLRSTENPSGGIGRHNKLKICRLIAIKVQALSRISSINLKNNLNSRNYMEII